MIPILYEKGCTDFSNNGIGFLVDCVSCEVTEEPGGAYEAVFTYPTEGRLYEYLTEGALIKVKPNETSDLQIFHIYGHSKPFNGIVTFNAEHISYELNGIPLAGLTLKDADPAMAIDRAIMGGAFKNNYKAWSDISTLNTICLEKPCSIRAALGGVEGSILDVWGGEYEFDNYTIKLHKERGNDNGVTIEYGKNLTDIQQEKNITETYTHIMPYAIYTKDELDNKGNITNSYDVFVYLEEKVLPFPSAENIGHKKAYIVDLSQEFAKNEEITEDSLRAKAETYIKNHTDLGTPSVSITASLVQLWQTEEYKDIAPLERVRLCDTVKVRFARPGISTSAKVVKTVYNVLSEKYISVELGETRNNFAASVARQSKELEGVKTIIHEGLSNGAEELKKAIRNATNLITGNTGGYVVLHPAENPQEILILDTPDIETAVRVWRWNSSGLGYSKTGYNGEYALAMTMDGSIVADFITAGTLNGILLKADSVQSNAISQGYKTEVIDHIEGTHEIVKQEFKAADEELKSLIQTSYTNDISALEIRTQTLIQQTAESIELSVSQSYATKTSFEEFQTSINQTASEIKSEVSQVKQDYTTNSAFLAFQSEVTQTATDIRTEVNQKGGGIEFGTYMQQNYNSWLLGFNGDSKVIQIATDGISIYDGAEIKDRNRLIRMNGNGMEIWRSGTNVGKIGTNSWAGYDTYRGLVFDLEYAGKYMCPARKTSGSADTYTVALTYAQRGAVYSKEGLYIDVNTFMSGNELNSPNIKDARTDGYATYNGKIKLVTKVSIKEKSDGGIEWEIESTDYTIKNGMFVSREA